MHQFHRKNKLAIIQYYKIHINKKRNKCYTSYYYFDFSSKYSKNLKISSINVSGKPCL